jgi:hypothetical protein
MKAIRPWLYVTLIIISMFAFTAILYTALAVLTAPDLWSIILYWGPMAGVVILYYTRFKSASLCNTADTAAEALSRELMGAKYLVERAGTDFIVRLDRSTGVAVAVKPKDQGCQASYCLKATPRGRARLGILTVIVPPMAFFLLVFYLSKAIRFGEGPLRKIAEGVKAQPVKRERGIRELLTEGLSEARRLALEAYEARRSDYEDMVILSFVMGLFALLVALLVSFYIGGWEGPDVNPLMAIVAGTVAFGFSTLLSVYLVRRKYSPQLDGLRSWNSALSAAFESEALPAIGDVTPHSSFELLAEASRELPTWVEIRRTSMMAREPLWSMLMVYSIYAGFFLLWGGSIAMLDGSAGGLIAAAIGTAAIVFGLLIYIVSAKRRAVEAKTLHERWRKRSDEMASHIEDLLGGTG